MRELKSHAKKLLVCRSLQVTVNTILADGNMGEVKLFDNEQISSHGQVFGLITLSKRPFLKSAIEITVTAIRR